MQAFKQKVQVSKLPRPVGFDEHVQRIHNHLYANANIRTPEGIAAEVSKILLTLINARRGGTLWSHLPTDAEVRAANLGDSQRIAAVAAKARAEFRRLNEDALRYPSDSDLALDDASIVFVLSEFAGVPFESSQRDWVGDALESFRAIAAKRVGGQFFTDQRVTELAVTLLDFDPDGGDDFVDVCAGTGGFLLAAARKWRAAHVARNGHQPAIFGIEVDADLASFANANLSAELGTSEHVFRADSLVDTDEWPLELRRRVMRGGHKCLASNPPFGTKITVKDGRILARYDLAHKWVRRSPRWQQSGVRVAPRPPDILFIERNLDLAEPGVGRVALVLPYQILSGPNLGYVREWMLRHARIRAVVDLPAETFQPWTGTKTALVVLERLAQPLASSDDVASAPVFMAVAEAIGHDRRGNPVLDKEGNVVTDLPAIGRAYESYRKGGDPSEHHAGSFVIDGGEINSATDLRLNAAFYRPASAGVRLNAAAVASRRGWTVRPLGELVRRVFCPTRFKRNYVTPTDTSVPFLGGSNITQLVVTTPKHLAKDDPQLPELRVEPGWVLVTRSGSTGIVSSVPPAWRGWALSEHVIRIEPRDSAVPGEYIEAFLRSDTGQNLLAAGVFGSVIDEITTDYVAQIPVPIPDDPAIVQRIAEATRRAREARQQSIESFLESRRLFEIEVEDQAFAGVASTV